jgi:cytochrome P450
VHLKKRYSLTDALEKYVLYLLCVVIYKIYFHPLRKYPGPKNWAATQIPWAISQFSGVLYLSTHELHKKYGNVVRISPDELSFIDPKAWKDIYTARTWKELMHKDGTPPAPKLKFTHKLLERSLVAIRRPGDADTILTAIDNRDHARIRRALANAFSTKALTDQEYYIQRYVSMFIDSLHSLHQTGPVNMVAWLEFVTFDIVGMIIVSLANCLPAKP